MRTPPGRNPSGSALTPILWTTGALTVLLVESIAVYFRAFTGFSWFDDEGYVLLGMRELLHGFHLYDQIYSQYGPFYFLTQSAIFTATGSAVTHEAGRWGMIGFWLLTALLCAWVVYRLTRSPLITAWGFLASVKILFFFTGSPGHPEELAIAMVAGLAVTLCYTGGRGRHVAPVVCGALTAALALTKVNIGFYAAAGIVLALLAASEPGRLRTAAYALLAILLTFFPYAVMTPLLGSAWAQRTCGLVALTIAATAAVAWRARTPPWWVTSRSWALAAVAFLTVSALVIARYLLAGTTLRAMLQMTVLQNLGFAGKWFLELPVYSEVIPLLSVMLALAWIRVGAFRNTAGLGWNAFKAGLGVLSLASTLGVFELGWKIPPTLLYNLSIPFCWLILLPSHPEEDSEKRFARTALALLSAVVSIYPLPVGGAQIGFAVFLMVPVSCILVDDAWRAFRAAGVLKQPAARLAGVAAGLLLACVSLFDLDQSVRRYERLEPLALSGASRIRVDASQAADYTWMTHYLRESCDAFFSMPELPSLYLWTNSKSPTTWNVSDWFGMLDSAKQEIIARKLAGYSNMCIVYNADLVEFWRRGQDLSRSPLARYIRDEFTAAGSRDGYEVLVRKESRGGSATE